MANSSIITGQSTAVPPRLNLPEILVTSPELLDVVNPPNATAGQFASPQDPSLLLNSPGLGGVPPIGITDLRYPLDLPPYWMSLKVQNYSRTSWNSIGVLVTDGAVSFPMADGLIDAHSIAYEEVPLGWAGGAVLGFQTPSQDQLNQIGLQQTATGALMRAGVAAADAIGGSVIKGGVSGALAKFGLAVNQFLVVMLRGPTYKVRQFQWHFSPKDSSETEALRKIEMNLNNWMAPNISSVAGSAFFTFPKVFRVSFNFAPSVGAKKDLGRYIFTMKPAVLTDAIFDYAPRRVPSFNRPDGTIGPGPESVLVQLTFKELEYWLAGDFGSG